MPIEGDSMKFFRIFIMLCCIWVVLSGKLDAVHLGLGFASAILITTTLPKDSPLYATASPGFLLRFFWYLGWLSKEIILANSAVFKVVFMGEFSSAITPSIIHFHSGLKHPISNYLLAQSITLTPGTVTLDLEEDKFTVHCLTKELAENTPGLMAQKISWVCSELEDANLS